MNYLKALICHFEIKHHDYPPKLTYGLQPKPESGAVCRRCGKVAK